MCSRFNSMGGIYRTVGAFKKLKKLVRGRAIVAAAVASTGLAFAGNAMGALADVLSIQTKMLTGTTVTKTGIKGAGTSSGFTSAKTYTEKYLGEDLEITKITTATSSYTPVALANTVVDRNSSTSNNNNTIWYAGSGNSGSSTLTFLSKPVTSVAQAYDGNNLLVGTDNLFANTGNNQNNNTNVERLDLLYSGGITASASQVFALFERGFDNQHDAFKIAAVTAIDASGNPLHYGNVVSITAGSYGNTDVVSNEEYLVTRQNNQIANDPQHPTDLVKQPIGGIVIPTDALATDGTTIYGYSLFAADVTGTGDNLVDWKNIKYFPNTTTEANGGGLDALGTAAVLFTSSPTVPEPTTTALALAGSLGLIARRPKRRLA